uniref:Putative secreted protein n=1 Tax=Ixodes ricinus TaxID=34613 RepID=A0A6B0UA02_IXORI
MFLSLLVVLLAAPLHLHANANVSNYRATHEDLKGVLPQCKASVGTYRREICSNHSATESPSHVPFCHSPLCNSLRQKNSLSLRAICLQ